MKTKIWAYSLFFCLVFAVSVHAGNARILRVTMNDGSTQYFWVDQISKIAVLTDKKDLSSSSTTVASSSSNNVASSSSETVASSSSEKTTRIASAQMINLHVVWNARQQTLLLSAENSTNAKVTVFDIQGIRVSQLNVPVLRGNNFVSLSSLHLANGKYVLHVKMDGVSLQKVVSIGKVGK